MIKTFPTEAYRKIKGRLEMLYGSQANALMERLHMLLGRYGVHAKHDAPPESLWSEHDVVLITYADMVQSEEANPLATLRGFLNERLRGIVSTVHLLPFYPWTSDDGFSVKDYRAVEPEYGGWKDIEAIGQSFDLMFDLVCNHCSASNSWFKDFVSGVAPGRHYFVEADPEADLSAVVRPRPTPLLTKVPTRDGDTWVWTTFSADQVDLNWQNPDLLFEFLDIIFLYLSKGARILRLDAIAFLWKEIGTTSLHLPQTHEIVKLIRDVVEIVAPEAIILTETNVPHQENISYFGQGDEAHMVYQFSLPPLLLHALLTGNSAHLTRWALDLEPPREGTTYFNFTASHDGVGVRPLQGILPNEELDRLIEEVKERGGRVSTRSMPDGSESPYELNITYLSALKHEDPELWMQRFLCSQAVALSLQGVPGIYFHSLFGTENFQEGVAETGHNRTINRRKWQRPELEERLAQKDDIAAKVHEKYLSLIRRRCVQPAFHPDGRQEIFPIDSEMFAVKRTAPDDSERILCLYNFTARSKRLRMDRLEEAFRGAHGCTNLINGSKSDLESKTFFYLQPYQALWLLLED